MPVPRSVLLILLPSALLIQPGGTASTPPAPPPEALIRQALEASPMLKAGAESAAAASETAAGAGALPDPMVEFMLQDVGFPEYTVGEEEMSILGVEIRQGLSLPSKRKAAKAGAGARAAGAGVRWELERRALALQVRQMHAELYALDREREALEASRELVDLAAAVAAARYGAGDAGAGAVLRAQLKADGAAVRLDDLAARRAGLTAELNAMRGLPPETPVGTVEALPETPAAETGTAAAGSPETALARARVREAELALDIARLESKPNLYVAAGTAARGHYDPVTTLRFGMEVPLWSKSKQAPMARAAERELAMARQEQAQAELDALRRAVALTARRDAERRQIVRYRESILPRTSEALGAARSAYLAGKGDFPAILESLDAWLEARIELAMRESARAAAEAELMFLAGNDPALAQGVDHEDR
jgi:outer membrane protein TolC